MELIMWKCKNLMWIVCICLICEKSTVAAENSNTSELSVLRNIFKPKNNINCIQGYGVNVSDYLNQFENNAVKNTTRLCFLIKGSLSVEPGLNHVNLSALAHLPKLQEFWIFPASHKSEADKNFITSLGFNESNISTSMVQLKQLHIEITLGKHVMSLTNILQASPKLEVLRVAKIHHFDKMEEIRGVLSGVKLTSLKALSLSGMLDNVISLKALNLSDVLGPLKAQDLEYLDLSQNYIYVIYGSITAMWPKLRIIDLSYNMLIRPVDSSFILDIMLHPRLEIVYYEGQNEDMTTELNRRRNTQNYMHITNDDINRKKRGLHKIYSYSLTEQLSRCMEKNNATINNLLKGTESKFCDIIYCSIKQTHFANLAYFPCKVFPSFEFIMSNLDFSGSCYYNFRFPLPPTLTEIYIGHYGGGGQSPFNNKDVHICLQQNKVKTLSLPSISDSTDTLLIDSMVMKYYSFYNLVVEDLDLSDNKFHAALISPLLTSLKYLTTLNLAHNFISFTGNETLYKYFPLMKKLDISFNNISSEDIPAKFFTNAVHMRNLNLAGNKLNTFSLYIKSAGNLSNLNISRNDITVFEIQTISDLKNIRQDNMLTIDLRNNKLKCGCSPREISTVDLIKNAEKYRIEFIDSNLYTCTNKNTTRLLLDIDMSQYKLNCNYPHLTLTLSILISNVALLTAILLSIMCYKYRYRLLTKFLRYKWHFHETKDKNENYIYDAFVSFSSGDRFWVHSTLVEKLEGKYGFKLCIHYRDFMAGIAIADEIVRTMVASKVIIVILSTHSLRSGWCDYELKIAHAHHIETGKKFVIIKLGIIDVQDELLTPFIKSILQSKVYVNWPEEAEISQSKIQRDVVEDKKMLFWVKIANTLYDRDVSCCLFCRKIGPQILQSVSSHESSEQNLNATCASASMFAIHSSSDGYDTERLLNVPDSVLQEQGNSNYNEGCEQNINVSISADNEDDKSDCELL